MGLYVYYFQFAIINCVTNINIQPTLLLCINVIIIYTGKWVKKTFETTLSEYKAMLHLWFQGTGGGSGNTTMFETWTEEKLNKYDIDPAVYDHTNIESRPAILIDGYAKHKKYLTMIFLWDEGKDYILASKYNPLKIGTGEAGLPRIESETSALTSITNGVTSSSKSPSKTSQ